MSDLIHPRNDQTAGIALEAVRTKSSGDGLYRYESTGAVLSADGLYRYRLWRRWDATARNLWFIMLNPSTADADIDDQTIRKCVGFAQRWGMGSVTVLNLFAFRATDPSRLNSYTAKGPDNDLHLNEAFHRARMNHEPVVAAWGNNALAQPRGRTVAAMARTAGVSMLCLARNNNGSPKHPPYVPYATSPLPLSNGPKGQDEASPNNGMTP